MAAREQLEVVEEPDRFRLVWKWNTDTRHLPVVVALVVVVLAGFVGVVARPHGALAIGGVAFVLLLAAVVFGYPMLQDALNRTVIEIATSTRAPKPGYREAGRPRVKLRVRHGPVPSRWPNATLDVAEILFVRTSTRDRSKRDPVLPMEGDSSVPDEVEDVVATMRGPRKDVVLVPDLRDRDAAQRIAERIMKRLSSG
jgi:hypothetical protein